MPSVTTNGMGGADDIVLTGLSGRLPESNSIDEFAQQLFDGVDLVTADGRRWMPGEYYSTCIVAKSKPQSGFIPNGCYYSLTFSGDTYWSLLNLIVLIFLIY